MKIILIIICGLFGVAQAQTTGYFRYDTTRFQKGGGNNEVYIENGTKALTGGVFTNMGNGLGRWVTPAMTVAGWGLTGNAGTTAGTNFLGTTDSIDFVGKTKGLERFRWNARGALGLGTGTDYGTSGYVLQTNGAGSSPTWVSNNPITTASNGLTKTSSNVKLGGILVDSLTTVDLDNKLLTFYSGSLYRSSFRYLGDGWGIRPGNNPSGGVYGTSFQVGRNDVDTLPFMGVDVNTDRVDFMLSGTLNHNTDGSNKYFNIIAARGLFPQAYGVLTFNNKTSFVDTLNSTGKIIATGLISAPGTKSLRIDAAGNVTYADTTSGGGSSSLKAYLPLVISGDSISQRFNVLAYGADKTGATNATVAIQNAINACIANGGGDVFFPNGTYLISSALNVASNSQIYIPAVDGLSTSRNHIRLIGETAPNMLPTGGGLAGGAGSTLVTGTVILKSNLTTYAASSAVIGTALAGGNFNQNHLSIENIAIQVKNNPGGAGPVVGGINWRNGGSMPMVKNVTVYIDTSGYNSVLPTNEVAGIITPGDGAETFNTLENCLVVGFKYGYIISEHTVLSQAQAWVCYNGFTFTTASHNTVANRISTYWCRNNINIDGICVVNVNLSAEWQSIGKWFDNVYTINDPVNLGKGHVFYTIVEAGVGLNNSKFSKNGSLYLYSSPAANGIAPIVSPQFVTSALTPILYGGTASNSSLTLQPTSSGSPTTGADVYIKSNGTTRASFLNNGYVGLGTTIGIASSPLHIKNTYAPSFGQVVIQDADPVNTGNKSTIYESYYDQAGTRLMIMGLGHYASATDPNYYFANEIGGGIVFRNSSANTFSVTNSGNVAIGDFTPTAKLHITAGTATASTAPLKFTAGVLLTTPEAFTQEASTTNIYQTNSALNRYALGGAIKDFITTVDNVGLTESDLYTYTTKASTLGADGGKLMFKVAGNFNDITATAQLQFYFAGVNIGNTGTLTVSAIGAWNADVMVIRTSATTARAIVTVNTPGASTALYTTQTDLTGLTLSGTNILKITGTAGGASGGNADISAKLGTISWMGAANN